MTSVEFDGHVTDLMSAIIGTIEAHFLTRRLTFNVDAFLAESSVDIGQFVREAYFHGAEVFPIDIERK